MAAVDGCKRGERIKFLRFVFAAELSRANALLQPGAGTVNLGEPAAFLSSQNGLFYGCVCTFVVVVAVSRCSVMLAAVHPQTQSSPASADDDKLCFGGQRGVEGEFHYSILIFLLCQTQSRPETVQLPQRSHQF